MIKLKNLKKLEKKILDFFQKKITFTELSKMKDIYLYAGDVPDRIEYNKYVGLSLNQWNKNHIKHNVINKYPLKDNCVNIYQSEDVFEHIEINKLPMIINEIYRVLKPKGVFRLSVPDYKCDILYKRTQKDNKGNLMFDPIGGGGFIDGKVVNGGHLWFPKYEIVKKLLEGTHFKKIYFFHYYDENGKGITNEIDYSIGYVMRTPDNDDRVREPYRPLSIVVDCIKEG